MEGVDGVDSGEAARHGRRVGRVIHHAGLASATVAANVARLREAQRLTYVELSKRLDDVGRPIAVLGLRRIEHRERRVDVDDLLALSVVLGVHPVDLLVPPGLPTNREFPVTSRVGSTAGQVREWIAGRGLLVAPRSQAELMEAVRVLPTERALLMLDRYREAS